MIITGIQCTNLLNYYFVSYDPLLSTLCVCVLGSPVVRPSGLGPGRKTSLIRYQYGIILSLHLTNKLTNLKRGKKNNKLTSYRVMGTLTLSITII